MLSSKACSGSIAAPRASLRVAATPAARRCSKGPGYAGRQSVLDRSAGRLQRCSATPEEIEASFDAQVCVVLGTQWGDEGKGKLVDILAQGYDVVARAQVWILTVAIYGQQCGSCYALVANGEPLFDNDRAEPTPDTPSMIAPARSMLSISFPPESSTRRPSASLATVWWSTCPRCLRRLRSLRRQA